MLHKLSIAVTKLLCCGALVLASNLLASDWRLIGPVGGNVRSLAFDPANPSHILLGTSTGQIFTSTDTGESWELLVNFRPTEDYVIDHIVFDPVNPETIYAAGWGLFHDKEGDVFRSDDGGLTWQALKGVHGKSIRALAMAPSDHNTLVIGARDGVFRSHDGGASWERMTPEDPPVMENYSSMKNFVSIAIDPEDPNIVYAGTSHLAWKTGDGGLDWQNITDGMVDDSDVFSIIVDPTSPSRVYASACTGIYKSENSGEHFHRIQGLPQSAMRTRVLKQDPRYPSILFAGTTGGLWKSIDFGATWTRVSAADLVVNDVLIDPRDPQRVLVATDGHGVLASNDGFAHYAVSNSGFSLRTVSAVVVDRQHPNRLYAGLTDAGGMGGVFVSEDAGKDWRQISQGLADHDILSLQQARSGVLVAGTDHGIFYLASLNGPWRRASMYWGSVPQWKPEKPEESDAGKLQPENQNDTGNVFTPEPENPGHPLISETAVTRVRSIQMGKNAWYAATNEGFFISVDYGHKWYGQLVNGERDFSAVNSYKDGTLTLSSHTAGYLSRDRGKTWSPVALPKDLTDVYSLTLSPDSSLWLGTHAGALRSDDGGNTWQPVQGGLPEKDVLAVRYDASSRKLLATVLYGYGVFESEDDGKTWQKTPSSLVSIRWATGYQGGLLAVSSYNGLVLEERGDTNPQDKPSSQVAETSFK